MSDLPLSSVMLPREPGCEVPRFGPIQKTERIASIDFIRGFALLGILLVNATAMFGPVAMLFDPALIAGQADHDRIASLVVLSLCQSKFISLFSMLFGYGLLGQIERAVDAGRSSVVFALRRLGTLSLFGLVHGVLIWYGDILFVYAILGGWLLLARGAKARTLMVAACCFLVVFVVLCGGLQMLGVQAGSRIVAPQVVEVAADGPRGLRAIAAGRDPASPVWVRGEIAAYRDGPWTDAMTFRFVEWLFINLVFCALDSGWLVLGMFLIGAVLWRVRFFSAGQQRLRWRVLLLCLPLGVLLEGTAGVFFWSSLTRTAADRYLWAVGGMIQGFAICFLPIGYLAGLALLADRLPAWFREPIASAGRMALTVYLLESVIATGLAYHWGLRWFGSVGALAQSLLALAIWGALVLFSWAYLRYFEQGPMEWLWRRLEYGDRRRATAVGGMERG